PLVLLMDEPFSAVDPVVRSELHEFFLGLQTELSKTIILITHDIDEAIKLGDQVAILRVGGRLAQVGTPQQLLDEPADAFVEGFVGRDRGFRALSFLPASGLTLGSVKVVRSTEAAYTDEPALVVDADARPQGWTDPQRPGGLLRLGGTFDPALDTLRVALDSALTSPTGLAVAVDRGTGRYAGVVDADLILDAATEARARGPVAPVRLESEAEETPTGEPAPGTDEVSGPDGQVAADGEELSGTEAAVEGTAPEAWDEESEAWREEPDPRGEQRPDDWAPPGGGSHALRVEDQLVEDEPRIREAS
ncbi:MAG: hypothetical protein ACLGIF_09140, partial [Actinomycetes bacterium]